MAISIIPAFGRLNLQLFADGAGSGDGDGGETGATGVNAGAPDLQQKTKGVKNPLADVKYGIQSDASPAAEGDNNGSDGTDANEADRAKRFEELIKGEYKDLYDARMQDTVQKRLKNSKETVDKYNALTPMLEMLAKKYGVNADDTEALSRAIEDDDSYYEDEASEQNLTVEQLKNIRKMERENAQLKAQMRDAQVKGEADRIYAGWMQQSESLKAIYPNFNLNAELKNQKFTDLLKNNVDVRTAYEVIHKDEIIPAAMQFTAKQVEQKLANKLAANGGRPAENGNAGGSPSQIKSDVTQLTKADRQEIIRRVARGEKIRF